MIDFKECFLEIFKFKKKYSTFEQCFIDSENPSNFNSIEDFWFFKEKIGDVFSRLKSYENFQTDKIFHFLIANSVFLDQDALNSARKINQEIFQKLDSIGDSDLGYDGYSHNGKTSTVNQCRHILMLTNIINYLQKTGRKIENLNIAEIGGGFGNFVRMVEKFSGIEKWVIFDMKFVTLLQKWFIENSTKIKITDDYNSSKISLIEKSLRDSIDYGDFDLLFACHSLSELSFNEFMWYKRNILLRSNTFFYVSCDHFPSNELIKKKDKEILDCFNLIDESYFENGSSRHWVLERK